jgi:uncharacterized protein YfiM (DUF2279 family)
VASERVENPTFFVGPVTFGTGGVVLPASVITDSQVAPAAGITQDKLEHQHAKIYNQAGNAVSETKAIYVARSAGTLLSFVAGMVGANAGAATVTFDLKKNGTTVLTAVVSLGSGDPAYTPKSGTLSVTSFVAGDVFTVVTVATAGGGTLGTGAFASLRAKEAA